MSAFSVEKVRVIAIVLIVILENSEDDVDSGKKIGNICLIIRVMLYGINVVVVIINNPRVWSFYVAEVRVIVATLIGTANLTMSAFSV